MVLLKGWAASLPPSLWDCPDCELGKVHNFPKIFVGVGEGGEGREEGLVCERGGILVSVCVSMSLICIGTELVCLCWARLEASSELPGLNPSPLSGRRGLSLSLKLMDLAWFFWETNSRGWRVSVAIPSPQVTDVTPWGCCGRELRPSWLRGQRGLVLTMQKETQCLHPLEDHDPPNPEAAVGASVPLCLFGVGTSLVTVTTQRI